MTDSFEALQRAFIRAHEAGQAGDAEAAEIAKELAGELALRAQPDEPEIVDRFDGPSDQPSPPPGKPKLPSQITDAINRAKTGQPHKGPSGKHYTSLKLPEGSGAGELGAMAQGATLGGFDELAAGVNTLVSDQSYDDSLKTIREQQEMYARENPVTATGLEIAGAIPTVALPVLNIAKGGSLLAKAGAGAAAGGAQGGIYGFNSGEGFEDRANTAATGGAFGVGLGAAAPVVGSQVGKLARKAVNRSTKKATGLDRPAREALEKVAEADGAKTATLADDAMLADAGPNSAALLDWALQKGGPGATAARNRIEARAAKSGKDLSRAMDDTLGTPQGVRSAARDIAQDTAAARQKAYDRAYATAVDYSTDTGRNIESVLSRVPPKTMRAAVDEANEEMLSQGITNRQIMLRETADGFEFVEMPNVQQLDEIKRALGTVSASAKDQFGRPTAASARAGRLARDLKNAVGDAVPGYRDAVRLGGDKIERDNALRLGRDLLRAGTTRETVEEGIEELADNAEAREALRIGIRGYIDDTLANVKSAMTDGNMDAREAMKAVKDLSSRASREKIVMALGKDEADFLYKQVAKAEKALGLRAAVAGNSKTFVRTAIDDSLQAGPVRKVVDNVGQNPIGVVGEITRAIGDSRRADKLTTQLADVLTQTKPQTTIDALNAANQNLTPIQRQRLAERLVRGSNAVAQPMNAR